MYIGSLAPGSNRAGYTQDFQLYDDEDETGIDLVEAAIVCEIRRPGSASPSIIATNGGDARILVADAADGSFALTLSAADMRALAPMTYECGIAIAQHGEIIQYFIGTLPVLDGIISK